MTIYVQYVYHNVIRTKTNVGPPTHDSCLAKMLSPDRYCTFWDQKGRRIDIASESTVLSSPSPLQTFYTGLMRQSRLPEIHRDHLHRPSGLKLSFGHNLQQAPPPPPQPTFLCRPIERWKPICTR